MLCCLKECLAPGGQGLVDRGRRSCTSQLMYVSGKAVDGHLLAALQKASEGATVGRRGELAAAFDFQEGGSEVWPCYDCPGHFGAPYAPLSR